MGLIPNNISEAYTSTPAGRPTLQDGQYNGVVLQARLGESRKPWVDVALLVQVQDHESGASAWSETEVLPLTDGDGDPHPKKLKFLKWQLEALGYDGSLEDLEERVLTFSGRQVTFDVTTKPSTKINPNTGLPYTNRDVKLLRPYDGELEGSPGGDDLSGLKEAFGAVEVPTNDDMNVVY